MSMLDNIVTMDELAVSFHMPESKQQSKQWLVKGSPSLIKAKVHATRKKQMVLAFFDSKGLIYTNFVPRGRTVNSAYIIEALTHFLKTLKVKRPTMTAGTWWFYWDNTPVHTAAVVTNWMAARRFQIIKHPPYSRDLLPADFFLFPSVKRSWLAKASPSRPTRWSRRGLSETSWRQTSPRPSGAGTSAAKSALTSLADMSRKATNTKCPNYNCFLFIGVVRV
jgi:histone-lysine N-methyltransferase SETMAR